jgi:hypothetical protein
LHPAIPAPPLLLVVVFVEVPHADRAISPATPAMGSSLLDKLMKLSPEWTVD